MIRSNRNLKIDQINCPCHTKSDLFLRLFFIKILLTTLSSGNCKVELLLCCDAG